MIELLIAIGIIMLLMTIGVFGLRSLQASAAQKQTRVALTNAAALLKEMESTGSYSRVEGLAALTPPPVYALGYTLDLSAPMDIKEVSTGKTGRINLLTDNNNPNSPNLPRLMRVLLVNPKIKQQIGSFSSGALLTPSGDEPARTFPVLADAWNNPLILVPSGGLKGVDFIENGATNQTITSSGQLTSPANRAFWASAGPDGDFTTGDDNLYSFQN